MSNTAQVIENNQSLFDDCVALLKHPKFAAEIGPQFDSDTLDQRMAPAAIESIVAHSLAKMRRKLAKQLQSRRVNPLRQRKANELRKEKKQRIADSNRKRYTRAWYRRHVPARTPDSSGRRSNGQPPESSRHNRFFGVFQEIKKQLRDKEGFVSLRPHEAIPLAGRVILMAALVADPAADWEPRITQWQGVPWDCQSDGKRLDGSLWVEDSADVDRVTGTRFLLRKFMFDRRDGLANIKLIHDAVLTWKRLVPELSQAANPILATFGRVCSDHAAASDAMIALSRAGKIKPETFKAYAKAAKKTDEAILIWGKAITAEMTKPPAQRNLDRILLPLDAWQSAAISSAPPVEVNESKAIGDNAETRAVTKIKAKSKTKSGKRRRTATMRPLTSLQQQAMELFAKHEGRITAIARDMGITHPTVNQHLAAAWRKLPDFAPIKTSRGRHLKQRLPLDTRGQVVVKSPRLATASEMEQPARRRQS